MILQDRAELYQKTFPKFPPLRIFNDRIEDIWFMGNDYTNTSNYYGAYPKGYLKRMNVLFPATEKGIRLHLFSGKLEETSSDITFDRDRINSNAQIIGEAEKLSEFFSQSFETIFADPPYSQEDAEHYGTCLIKRNTVVKECHKVLQTGGHLVWLDQVFPMFSKRDWKLVGMIGIVISTNHRARLATILERI